MELGLIKCRLTYVKPSYMPPMGNHLKIVNLIVGAIPPDKTREQVAKEVGISRGHLQRIIASRQAPSIEIALKLSTVLKTPIDELFQLQKGAKRKWRKK